MLHIKYFAFAAAVGLMLLAAPESQAQHRGGGGGRGGGGHAVHAGAVRGGAAHFSSAGVHRSAVVGTRGFSSARSFIGTRNFSRAGFVAGRSGFRNDFGRFGRGFDGRGFGRGFGGWGGGWWPGYWGGGLFGGYNYGPYYDYGYSPSYYDATPYDYYGSGGIGGYVPNYSYYPPADYGPTYNPPAAVAVNTAHIEVFVPDPNAKLWFDGRLMTTPGLTRDFDTPPLQPGSKYSYTVRASWMQGGQVVTEECVVPLQVGQQLLVDFNHNPPQVRPLR